MRAVMTTVLHEGDGSAVRSISSGATTSMSDPDSPNWLVGGNDGELWRSPEVVVAGEVAVEQLVDAPDRDGWVDQSWAIELMLRAVTPGVRKALAGPVAEVG